MNKILITLLVLAGLLSSYELGFSEYVLHSTGQLNASSSDNHTTFYVSASGRVPQKLGNRSVKVRLQPGDYQLIALSGQDQKVVSFHINKQITTNQRIDFSQELQKAKYIAEANSLIKYLPYTGRLFDYNISYTYQQTDTPISQPIIIITAPAEAGHQAALKWISSLGFVPSHLNIKYVPSAIPL